MREICTSGSVGGEDGNVLAYPAQKARLVRRSPLRAKADAPLPAECVTAGTPRSTGPTSKWRAGGFARPTVRCDRNML